LLRLLTIAIELQHLSGLLKTSCKTTGWNCVLFTLIPDLKSLSLNLLWSHCLPPVWFWKCCTIHWRCHLHYGNLGEVQRIINQWIVYVRKCKRKHATADPMDKTSTETLGCNISTHESVVSWWD